MGNPLERLEEINSHIEKLRIRKKELKELRQVDKENKLLFRDDHRLVRHRIRILARERSQLPITLNWSGDERKRRQELLQEMTASNG